jgi:hypothetical protein
MGTLDSAFHRTEHSVEVLTEAGFGTDEIARWLADGTVIGRR